MEINNRLFRNKTLGPEEKYVLINIEEIIALYQVLLIESFIA